MQLTMYSNRFRIAQLTDLHFKTWHNGVPTLAFDHETVRLVEKSLKELQPQLLVITGDLVDSPYIENPEETQAQIIEWINHLDIPTLITYGNHDSECRTSRSALRAQQANLKYQVEKVHVFVDQDRENYTVPVFCNEKCLTQLFIMDSGDYVDKEQESQRLGVDVEDLSPYAYLTHAQIEWIKATSEKIASETETSNILFMHIPFPEYKQVREQLIEGVFEEDVCSATYNSGTFEIIKNHSNIKYVTVGHDHDNNFVAQVDDIHLCYGQPSGYGSYGKLKRGIRYFDISSTGDITTAYIEK